MRTATVLSLVLLASLLVAPPAAAQAGEVLVVDTAEDPVPDPVLDTGCLADDDSNACSLREAIMYANANGNGTVRDIIVFAPSLAAGTTITLTRVIDSFDTEQTGDLDILQPLLIDGDHRITVSGAGMQTGNTNDSDRVFHIADPEADPGDYELANMAVTGGFPNHEPVFQASAAGLNDGGGILADVDHLDLTDVHVYDNVSRAAGGGIAWFGDGRLRLDHVTVENNAAFKGGGIYVEDGFGQGPPALEVLDSTVADNALTVFYDFASSGSGFAGGGLTAYDTAVVVRRSRFTGNGSLARPLVFGPGLQVGANAPSDGGAISIEGFADLTHHISDSLLDDNEAFARGGAVSVAYTGRLQVSRTTFSANVAGPSEGTGPPAFAQCCGGGGGAIHLGGAPAGAVLRNVTLTGNRADDGGAILHDQDRIEEAAFAQSAVAGRVELVHVTVADNVTAPNGPPEGVVAGDLAVIPDGAPRPGDGFVFTNSILQGDTGTPASTTCHPANPQEGPGWFTSLDGNANPDGSCLSPARTGDTTAVQDLQPLDDNDTPVRTGGATMGPDLTAAVPTRALAEEAEGIDTAVTSQLSGEPASTGITCGTTPPTFAGSDFAPEVLEDQRTLDRPAGDACDRGAFEVQPEDPDPGPGPGPTPTLPARDVSVTKNGPSDAEVGDEVTFEITVTSAGRTSNEVVVIDDLPGDTTFVSASEDCALENRTVRCDVGRLLAGASATVQVTVTVDAEGTVTNTACQDHLEGDADPANDCDDHAVDVDETVRVGGEARIETAVAGSREAFPTGAAAVVLARQDEFPDAQVGTPLAVAVDGPLLLTEPTALSAPTETEILRLLEPGATVYLLGGERAVSAAVEARLIELGLVPLRLGGPNRFATATVVADFLEIPPTVLVSDGGDFRPTILAGAAATAIGSTRQLTREVGAVLLTDGPTLAPETRKWLETNDQVVPIAIGDDAVAALPQAEPVPGDDPFALSVDVAERFFSSPTAAGLASVADFPDALIGGAVVNSVAVGPMLFTDPDSLPPVVDNYLTEVDSISSVYVFGGPLAVADAVADRVGEILSGR